jgi:hypothetical protein
MKIEYQECAECAAKPGSPTLCPSCLHNRTQINRLVADLEESLKQFHKLAKYLGACRDGAIGGVIDMRCYGCCELEKIKEGKS